MRCGVGGKRVSSARDEATLTAIRTETEDRYGRVPLSLDRLFAYARLRRLAEDLGLLSIDRTPDGAAIKFSEKARISPERLAEFERRSDVYAQRCFAARFDRRRAGRRAGSGSLRVAPASSQRLESAA